MRTRLKNVNDLVLSERDQAVTKYPTGCGIRSIQIFFCNPARLFFFSEQVKMMAIAQAAQTGFDIGKGIGGSIYDTEQDMKRNRKSTSIQKTRS